jgi:hypothetical protein
MALRIQERIATTDFENFSSPLLLSMDIAYRVPKSKHARVAGAESSRRPRHASDFRTR